jgi:phosphoribosylformimino-5-aminoimidazole carboxamide ribotide isomerase
LTSDFELLPAIDLRGGRVVRLEQGDFERETRFSDDPRAVAASFVASGARWLHVVDLDGARAGGVVNGDAIAAIIAAAASDAAVDLGGGMRTVEAVRSALDRGAARVALGTAALAAPDLVAGLIRRFGAARIAVAVDVRDGLARGEAWRDGSPGIPPDEVVERLAAAGADTFEVTAIDRDGLLGGPDLELLARLVGLRHGRIIASGGIRTAEDVRAVRRVGCRGAIIGRALYDGSLTVEAALAAAGGDEGSSGSAALNAERLLADVDDAPAEGPADRPHPEQRAIPRVPQRAAGERHVE